MINELLEASGDTIAVLRERHYSDDWKVSVALKFETVDFVLFLLGRDTYKSENIKWEYRKAVQLNKRIIGLKLDSFSEKNIRIFKGIHIAKSSSKCFAYLSQMFFGS